MYVSISRNFQRILNQFILQFHEIYKYEKFRETGIII